MYLIRKCSTKDVRTIYELICLLEAETLDYTYFKKVFNKNIVNKNIIYLKCTYNNELIGFISCHIQDLLHHEYKVAEIQEMFVVSEYRNKGIGTLLINEVIPKLKTKNVKLIEVTAQKKRKKAHQFYIHNQFIKTHFKFNRNI